MMFDDVYFPPLAIDVLSTDVSVSVSVVSASVARTKNRVPGVALLLPVGGKIELFWIFTLDETLS